jgi:membrane protease subunit HflC
MQAERQRIALRYRAEGEEKGREIRANADKEREIILAKAYQESQSLRGAGDAQAITVTGQAFGRDPVFYGFVRRLETYERVFSPETTIVLRPDSDLLRYLDSPRERR